MRYYHECTMYIRQWDTNVGGMVHGGDLGTGEGWMAAGWEGERELTQAKLKARRAVKCRRFRVFIELAGPDLRTYTLPMMVMGMARK